MLSSCTCLIWQAKSNPPCPMRDSGPVVQAEMEIAQNTMLPAQYFHPYVFQIFAQLIELRLAPLP